MEVSYQIFTKVHRCHNMCTIDESIKGAASQIRYNISAAASGWAGWALAHLEFGNSVNPITTRGADYAHHITASPPGFENPAAALLGVDR